MSYEYNRLEPSTIQEKKQSPVIQPLIHRLLSIDQIDFYESPIICMEDIAELYQNGKPVFMSQEQFDNHLFQICQSCHQSKKKLIAPFSQQLQNYLKKSSEYTKYILVYIDASQHQCNVQQFFFLYRKVAKMNKVDLILRAQDLFVLYQSTPFEFLIAQYTKSGKYVNKFILQDLYHLPDNKTGKYKVPFEGELFDVARLSNSITLFYYILKQSLHFFFDFRDPKSLFKTLITKFKQLEFDLNPDILAIYNLILSSLYQDKELIDVLTQSPDISLDIHQQNTINKYKARQGLLSFLQSNYNQLEQTPLLLQSQAWKYKNVPNDLVRFIIAIQIPAVLQQSKTVLQEETQEVTKPHNKELSLKMLYKYAVEFDTLRASYLENQVNSLIISKAKELFSLEQLLPCIKYIQELIHSRVSTKIKFVQVGALARNEKVNITGLSFLILDKELRLILDNLDKLVGKDLFVLQSKYKLLLRLNFKGFEVPVQIEAFNSQNKGLMLVKHTSTPPFWNSLTRLLSRQLLVVKKNTLINKNTLKTVPVQSEKQLFQLVNLKFIEPEVRNSFQISKYYSS